MSEEMTNPIDEPVVQTEEVNPQEEEFNESGEVAEPVDDDSEEVEHDGQKYRVPKALRPALMMQSDYTKKTQEVSETRKALETERQTVKQQAEVHQRNILEVAKFVSLDEQLKEYDQVNYDELNQTDPVRAQQLWIKRTQLSEQRQALLGQLQQRERQIEQERQIEGQRNDAKRIEECRAYIATNIKDWSQKMDESLTSIGREMGFSDEELRNANLRTLKLLHRAYLGDQVLKKQRTTTNPPTTQAKPVTQVGGNATAKKSPSQMTDKEFAAMRRSQIAKRN